MLQKQMPLICTSVDGIHQPEDRHCPQLCITSCKFCWTVCAISETQCFQVFPPQLAATSYMYCRYILFLHCSKKKKKEGGQKTLLMQQTEILLIFRVAAKLLKIPVLQMATEGPLACVVMLSGPPQLLAQFMMYYTASISALSGDLWSYHHVKS